MNVATVGRNRLRTASLQQIFDSLGLYHGGPRDQWMLVPTLAVTVQTEQLSRDQIGRVVILGSVKPRSSGRGYKLHHERQRSKMATRGRLSSSVGLGQAV